MHSNTLDKNTNSYARLTEMLYLSLSLSFSLMFLASVRPARPRIYRLELESVYNYFMAPITSVIIRALAVKRAPTVMHDTSPLGLDFLAV